MDFGDLGTNLPFIIGAIALVFIQFFLKRKRGGGGNEVEIVQNLLAEVRLNIRIAEVFDFSSRAKKFMTTTWHLNKNKLDFLGKSLEVSVSNAFMMAEDYNQQIAAAKKYKSTSYMISIDIEKLKGLLSNSQQGLEQWMVQKVGTKNPPEKVPGVFDDLLGKR